jgi:membrane protein YqaA with SNARE-associated domain
VIESLAEAGPLGLFLVSFLAATLVPLSSEVALVAGLAAGVPPAEAVTACSLGNCLACTVNYGLGWFFREKTEARMTASRAGRKALGWMDRYGWASLLLSWAPVVGDPLTVVAGIARVSFALFALVVFTLRVGRYLLIAGLF